MDSDTEATAMVATTAMDLDTEATTTERGGLRLTPTSCTVDTTDMVSDTAMAMATLMEPDTPTTAMDLDTEATTMERGVLMLSPRLRLTPTSCTVDTTDMVSDTAMAMATLMEPDTPTTDKV